MGCCPKAHAEYKGKPAVDAVVRVKGKAQTRESQTTLLADIVQTHVESYVGIDDATPALQAPLLNGSGPTINGVAISGPTISGPTINGVAITDYSASENGLPNGDEAWSGGEVSPFSAEAPEWMRDGSAPAPLGVQPVTLASAAAMPGEEADAEGEEADAEGE